MADEELGFSITATDNASSVARQAAQAVTRAAVGIEQAQQKVERATRRVTDAEARYGRGSLEAREASTRLRAAQLQQATAAGRLATAQERAQEAIADTGDAAGEAQAQVESMSEGLKTAAGVAGVAAGAALAAGLQSSLDFGAAQAKFRAQLGLTAEDGKKYGAIAGKLYAGAYGESIDQVYDALRESQQQGLFPADATNDQIQKTTAEVLNLSSTFDQDLGGTAKAVGQLIRTGLVKDANEGLDLITYALQKIPGAGEDLIDTLNEYSTQFRAIGVDGPQAVAFIGAAMKGGARDTDLAADALKELNLRAKDLTNTAAQSALKQLGLDAQGTARQIAGGGSSAVSAVAAILTKLKAIPDPATRATLATSLLGSQAEDLQGALYAVDPQVLVDGLGDISQAAEDVDKTLGETAKANVTAVQRWVEQTSAHLAGMSGDFGNIGAAVVLYGTSAAGAAVQLAQLFSTMKIARLTQAAATAATATDTTVIGANTAAREANALAAAAQARAALGAAGAGAAGAGAGAGAGAAAGAAGAGAGLGRIGGLQLGLIGAATFTNKKHESLDDILAAKVTSGKAGEAKKTYDELTKAQGLLNIEAGKGAEAFPAYTKAVEAAAKAQGDSAKTAVDSTAAAESNAKALYDQSLSYDDLATKIQDAGNAMLGLRGSQRGVEASFDAVSGSIKENGKTLDITTEKGRNNQEALDGVAAAGLAYANSLKENGGTEEQFQAALSDTHDDLVEQARRFGLSAEKAEAYADSILDIPPKTTTEIQADISDANTRIAGLKERLKDPKLTRPEKIKIEATLKKLQTQVAAAKAALKGIPDENVTLTLNTKVKGGATDYLRGLIPGYANGGPVRGPGTRTSDSIPMNLSNGEYVLTADDVDAIGGPAKVLELRKQLHSPQRGSMLAAGGGGGRDRHDQLVRVLARGRDIDYDRLSAAMVNALARAGLTVQLDGRAVGRVQGQRSDLIRRGG